MVLNRKPLVFIFIMIFVLVPRQGRGDVYVWTDRDGIRHYSNISPPHQGQVRRINEVAPEVTQEDLFKVIRVFDGDTLEAKGAGLRFKVRLAGIDTPETGRQGQKSQPYAREAKQALIDQIMGRQIRLRQFGIGGYNRILAEVFSNGRNINLYMVQTGMAEIYRGAPPPGLDIGAYEAAQKMAKRKRAGIWSLGKAYKSPRQWRKENPW